MTQNLNNFLAAQNNKKYATKSGTKIHTLLKNIVLDDVSGNSGDAQIVEQIQQHPELKRFFAHNAQTEVPLAGTINGTFISRRLDRLLIDNATKTVSFIDYKTDTDKQTLFETYKKQLSEYAQLLRSAYQGYKITGYILWTQDWQLQQII